MRRKSILQPSAKPKQKVRLSVPNKKISSNSGNDTASVKSNFSAGPAARKYSGSYGTRGAIGLEQTVTIIQKTVLRQESPFAESCLPKMMKIALDSRELLFPLLRSYPSSWSFIDKVFVMLAPVFQEDVKKHYANKGQCLIKMYHCLQIERFDKILSRDLLEKIEAIKLKDKNVPQRQRA